MSRLQLSEVNSVMALAITSNNKHFVHVQLEHFPGLKGHETAMVESAEEKMIQLCKNITFFDKK